MKAVDYERYINRAGDEEIMSRWQNDSSVTITKYEDMDIDSFKNAVSAWLSGIRTSWKTGIYGCNEPDRGIYREIRQQHWRGFCRDHSDLGWEETNLELHLLHHRGQYLG